MIVAGYHDPLDAMQRIVEEILKFIFIYCLINFFYWTGQLIFVFVTFGYYVPAEKYEFGRKAVIRYREYFIAGLSVASGFTFWLITFPLLYDLFK